MTVSYTYRMKSLVQLIIILCKVVTKATVEPLNEGRIGTSCFVHYRGCPLLGLYISF